MVEDAGKEEEKFDFTPEGEALGYISLDQARVLAMRTARETPGAYGTRFASVPMAFEVVEDEETEDHYIVTLAFRPEGEFSGTPGREQFFIEKEGNLAVRQVLSLPGRVGWRRIPIGLVAVGLVVVVAAAVGGVFAATGGGDAENDDIAGQVAAAIPTDTPVPFISTPMPTPTTAPAITPPLGTTSTPVASPAQTPSSSPTPVPGPTFTPIPTSTLGPTFTPIPTSTPGPTSTPIPTATPRPTSTPTPTPLPTPTRPPTPSPTPIPGIPAGSVVEIQYKHRVWLSTGRTFETEWDPGETAYEPRWDFDLSRLVFLDASFNSPLALGGMLDRPLPIDQSQEKFTYRWPPASKFHANFEQKLILDSGLRISRNIAPKSLPPGTTQVVIEVTVEIVRPPTISGITVLPLEGSFSVNIGDDGNFRAGGESKARGGIRPVRVISVSGPVSARLSPLLEPGQKDTLRFEAVIENPNLFSVSYLPHVDTYLNFDADRDAAPFKVSIPRITQTRAPILSFDAVGIAGVRAEFTFSNPSGESVFWLPFSEGFTGLQMWWEEQLQVAR